MEEPCVANPMFAGQAKPWLDCSPDKQNSLHSSTHWYTAIGPPLIREAMLWSVETSVQLPLWLQPKRP